MKKWNYYNDTDPKACAWAKELIKQKLVPDGEVDCRSIEDVRPDEIKDFIQCHFFCGILGWSYALELAGWPSDRPVWTGSCPCQPFSTAGKRKAQEDERHLWPALLKLIGKCRPKQVFGEQVASAIRHGWLDEVSSGLEKQDYSCGAAVLGAHSIELPHHRQRLYWVAHSMRECGNERGSFQRRCEDYSEKGGCGTSGLRDRFGNHTRSGPPQGTSTMEGGGVAPMDRAPRQEFQRRSSWRSESTPPPLAHGIPARVVRLRGYGNAIAPEVAAEFIGAYLDVELGIGQAD